MSQPIRRARARIARPALTHAVAALTASALLCTLGCEKPPLAAPERPPAPVAVVAAVAKDVPVYLDEIGKCTAIEMVSIQPQISGRLVQIHFADGASVKSGELLFTIDERPYQAKLQAAQALVSEAKAQLELARTEFGRVEKLAGTKAVAQQDYDEKKNAIEVMQAGLALRQSAVDTAQLDLEYCTIRAPIDGRAGHRLVDQGNVVTPMSTLLVIQRLDPIYAEFTVTQNDLSAVQENMARGTVHAEVALADDPQPARVGQLTFVDNAVQESSGTVRLRATLANADQHFWPGRFVNVRLVLRTIAGAVLVPATAVQMSAKGPYVYVVKDDSSAELRLVRPGQRQAELTVIEQGLATGERVVVTGQMAVTPGGKVHVEEPAKGANGATAAAEGQP